MSAGHIPPIFVSHGAPALGVDAVRGAELGEWARTLQRPRAVLVISAHWQAPVLSRGSTALRPPLLRDYEGYPAALVPANLRDVTWSAPGTPELASDLHAMLPVERAPDRGWDHGVWTPLVHLFPAGDIPVLQLSLVLGATPRHLFAIGKAIGPLASRGVLIVGSGGFTYNLAELGARADAPPATWARDFDTWAANRLADADIDELFQWRTKGPHAQRANPASAPFQPLFVVAGAASLYEHAVGYPHRGFEYGSLSRRCVQLGR